MSEINILYPFDNNYAPFAGISLTSLLENNQHVDSIRVYILGFDISDENIERFRDTTERYKRDLVILDSKPIVDFINSLDVPAYRGASVAIARLLVTRFIPETVKRLLYLDSDTITVGDLCQLVDCDLEGNPVGMVCDSVAGDYKKIMEFGPDEYYFNAGMILFDMDEWRKQGCTERIIGHIKSVRKNYEALDQDLINIVLKGSIKKLDLRYNFQPVHYVYSPEVYQDVYGIIGYYEREEIKRARDNCRILHAFRYLGMFPWHEGSIHPYGDTFNDYKRISAWSGLSPIACELSLTHKVEQILYHIFPKKLFLHLFRITFIFKMKKIEKKLKNNHEYMNI